MNSSTHLVNFTQHPDSHQGIRLLHSMELLLGSSVTNTATEPSSDLTKLYVLLEGLAVVIWLDVDKMNFDYRTRQTILKIQKVIIATKATVAICERSLQRYGYTEDLLITKDSMAIGEVYEHILEEYGSLEMLSIHN